jgi:transcriptional regulator with XRE-family HTH domain
MSGENGTNGTAPQTPVRRRDYFPNIRELRRLIEQVTGSRTGSQAKLAELVGCTAETISSWEKGTRRPYPSYRAKLVEIEKRLKAKKGSALDEVRDTPMRATEPPAVARPLPLVANRASARMDAEQVLLRFALKLPGEDEPRSVAEILVPRAALECILRPPT